MEQKILRIARKHSLDKAQEQLRQTKDDWNLQVKELIALLIPFKRGMNGKGDAKIGIPPSNIKDPLPPQMGHYLSEISNRYSKVVEDAQKLMDAQAYYSSNRRKSQPKTTNQSQSQSAQSPSVVKAVYEPGLVAEASWWGSRGWARIALLKKIDRHNRRIRVHMLGSGADIYRDFKKFEGEILNYSSLDSIPNSVRQLANGSLDFLTVFLRAYDKLIALYNALEDGTVKPLDTKPAKTDKSPKSPKPIKTENHIKTEENASPEIWEKFKHIYAQLVKIEVVVKYLTLSENLGKFNTDTGSLRGLYDAFIRDLTVLYDLTKRTDHGKSAVELEKLSTDVVAKYQQILQIAVAELGPAADFDELITKIPKPTVAAYLEIVNNQAQLQKLAAGAVTRWLRKNWLSINPNNLDRIRVEMSDTSVNFRTHLNALLDMLENREIGIAEISGEMSKTCRILSDLIDQAMSLSKKHMITDKGQKTKEHTLIEIKRQDLIYLRDIKNSLAAYIKDPGA